MLTCVVMGVQVKDDFAGAVAVATTGAWRVVKATDPMSDEIECTALHECGTAIQLTKTASYMRIEVAFKVSPFGSTICRSTVCVELEMPRRSCAQ